MLLIQNLKEASGSNIVIIKDHRKASHHFCEIIIFKIRQSVEHQWNDCFKEKGLNIVGALIAILCIKLFIE